MISSVLVLYLLESVVDLRLSLLLSALWLRSLAFLVRTLHLSWLQLASPLASSSATGENFIDVGEAYITAKA